MRTLLRRVTKMRRSPPTCRTPAVDFSNPFRVQAAWALLPDRDSREFRVRAPSSPRQYRLPFDVRLGLATSLLVALVCAGLSWQLARGALGDLRANLVQHGRTVATALRHDAVPALRHGDLGALAELVERARVGADVLAVRVFDPAGLLLAGAGVTTGASADPPGDTVNDPTEGPNGWEFGATIVDDDGTRLGSVSVLTSHTPLDELRRRIVLTAVTLTGLFMLVGAFGALGVARAMTHSLGDLARAAERIAAGDFATRVATERHDELGTLARSFNSMVESLGRSRTMLEDKVREAERANHLKSEFLATVSHELRTPLNVIIGHAEMLDEASSGKRAPDPEIVRTIRRYAALQLDLITSVLDFERLSSGEVRHRVEAFDLRTLVDDVLALHGPRMRVGVQLQASVAPEIAQLETDRIKVHQVLRNLVDNAIKFTESGRITIEVGPAAAPERVVIAVTDTGPGIPADELPLVFEPFHQVGSSSTRRTGGVGLGLAIVERLVAALGGVISVSSEIGWGTTFRVELPRRLAIERAAELRAVTTPGTRRAA
jgi:signal transduction histidine kinase